MNYITERREEEKERRREEILDAAERIFAEKGFDSATMDQVAKEARVSRALVYVYFKDKESLFLGICFRGLSTLRDLFQAARERYPRGAEQVRAIGQAYRHFSEQYPVHFAALSRFEAKEPDLDPSNPDSQALELLNIGKKVHEQTVLALLQGQQDGSIKKDLGNLMQVSIMLWGFTHGTIQLARTKCAFMQAMGIDQMSFMDQALDLVMQALIPPNQEST